MVLPSVFFQKITRDKIMTTATASEWTIESYQQVYSDYHKEAHGVRPRHDTSSWTLEDWKSTFDVLSQICQENALREQQEQHQAAWEFEERTIPSLIAKGAKDRETAIRWLLDAEQTTDKDYLCFCLGLEYGYLGK